MKNSLQKVSTEFEIIEFEDKKTFTITKEKEKIVFYDEKLIEEVIEKKFNEKYKRLLYIITDISSSEDATETDAELVRNQILELRNLLINKYGRYIQKELLNKYLKMLMILDSKLVIPKKRRGR